MQAGDKFPIARGGQNYSILGSELIPDLSGYVPYSGATESLNLDEYNLYAYNVINGISNIFSSGGTTNITLASTRTQRLTGSQNHSFKFDSALILPLSFEIEFLNESTGNLSIVDFSNGVQAIVPSGGGCVARLVGTGTAAGTWSIKNYIPRSATWGDEVLNIPFLNPSEFVATDGSGNLISVPAPINGLTWNTVTDETQTITINNGYVAKSATKVDFTLPTVAAFGESFEILYLSPQAGQLLQNAGQTIIAGEFKTAIGTAGRIEGINSGESLVIRCTNANTEFMVISPVGNFNVIES